MVVTNSIQTVLTLLQVLSLRENAFVLRLDF
jgi:hypothetical protein